MSATVRPVPNATRIFSGQPDDIEWAWKRMR